tara:strand:- start:81 stop:356 length:276 start_codon:yes stop_codon:yes gene_type:complete
MKKYLIIFFGAIMTSSCGADQATVDSASQELCDALSGIDIEDPSKLMDAAMAMMAIVDNEKYVNISEAQLENSMKENCPDGWSTFEELMNM